VKVTREKAAENRNRVVETAAQLFRERGYDGIGVADLMKKSGLTHGGFYGHFASKEQLIAEASIRALANSVRNWEKVISATTGNPLEAIAAHYLSSKHRAGVGTGCLFAALGAEVPRHGTFLRNAVTQGLLRFVEMLSRIVPGHSAKARRQRALATYASLVGGMVLARAVSDASLSNEILCAVATSLTKTSSIDE
jgi:TetR/AcrR family transcriptional regulator, transcriptional repressor for nem operon